MTTRAAREVLVRKGGLLLDHHVLEHLKERRLPIRHGRLRHDAGLGSGHLEEEAVDDSCRLAFGQWSRSATHRGGGLEKMWMRGQAMVTRV